MIPANSLPRLRVFVGVVALGLCVLYAVGALGDPGNGWLPASARAASVAVEDVAGEQAAPRDLAQIRAAGVLRHLGVPYANFVTGDGDGLDVRLIQEFAEHLGVTYVYVPATWDDIFPKLLGREILRHGAAVELGAPASIEGDLIANGLTVLPWRERIIDYSHPTFPTQIWLLAKDDSELDPIRPSGSIEADLRTVKTYLEGRTVLCKAGTCLDPALYGLQELGAKTIAFEGTLNELAPAVIASRAETTILDVPDALVALRKWPGRIKVIGPVTPRQTMGVGFAESAVRLRAAFNAFFEDCWASGRYQAWVVEYYPTALTYYPEFFARHSPREPAAPVAERE